MEPQISDPWWSCSMQSFMTLYVLCTVGFLSWDLCLSMLFLILVIQLFHCAIFNGYEALIVITHSCNPSSNQIRTLFWGLLGRYRKFPYLSVHGHLGNHGTLIERTSTAFSSPKGDSIWHSFTVPLYYMWTCCFPLLGIFPRVTFCVKMRRVNCLTLLKNKNCTCKFALSPFPSLLIHFYVHVCIETKISVNVSRSFVKETSLLL